METNTKPAREPRTMPSRERRTEAPSSIHPLMGELIEKVQRINEIVAVMNGTGPAGPAAVANGAVTVKEAMTLLGIKRTKLNELVNSEAIVKRKLGRRTLLLRSSIEQCLHDSVVPAEVG